MRAVIFAVLLVLAPLGAVAQDGSIFTVPRVPVFAEADDAAKAQTIAQAQGRKVAMDILLRRLTAEEDWGYLPRLAVGRAPNAIASPEMGELGISLKQPLSITADDLTRLELSFAPYDEKTSRKTYRAEVTYRFNPAQIRSILTDAGLPYSESQTRRALVLPVLETATGLYLWESKNPWARAWLSRPFDNELTPLILPRGHTQDVETLTAEEAKGLDQEALRVLADRYRVPQVVVALGKLTEKDGEQQLYVRLIDGYLDGRGDSRRRRESGSSEGLYDSGDGFGAGATRRSAGSPGQTLAEAFFRAPTGDFPKLAKRATEATVNRYADDWKARTLVDHSAVREFRLTAWFQSLDEWAEIRSALEGTALVVDTDMGVFNNENAVIDVRAIGAPEQFDLAMRQQNLEVWRARDGWHIADAARARVIKQRILPVSASEAAALDRAEREAREAFPGYEGGTNQPDGRLRDPFGAQEEDLGPIDARSGVEGRPGSASVPSLPDDLFGDDAAAGADADADEEFLDY